MRNIIVFGFLFVSLALAQKQSVVVLPSQADSESKIAPKELDVLTEDIRSIVTKNLPKTEFNLLKQDEVIDILGPVDYFKNCEEGTCVGKLVELVQANFGAMCKIYTVGKQLYMNFELYGTYKGESKAGTLDQFNEPVKNFAEIQAKIKKDVPDMFIQITKVQAELDCKSKGGTWVNGACRSRMSAPAATNEPGIMVETSGGAYIPDIDKHYLLNLNTDPEGAVLTIFNFNEPIGNCNKTPCKAELPGGEIRIIAAMEQYETKDTSILINKNNQNINMKLKPNFGTLNIRTAFSDNIGSRENWYLTVNNKAYSSFENRFSPGTYNVKLSHECYEDISFKAGINKGTIENFNMSEHIKLKQGGLSLSAERDGEPISEPVFVNGRKFGETPFSGPVPVCSEVKVGSERVNVELKHKQTVKHTHRMSSSKKWQSEEEVEEEYEPAIVEKKTDNKRKKTSGAAKTSGATGTGNIGPYGLAIGGGLSLNMNDIHPDYLKSLGGQISIGPEFNRQDLGLLRFALVMDIGSTGINRNKIKEDNPKVIRDSIGMVFNFNVKALARLYPVDFLFLSGGAGWNVLDISSKKPKLDDSGDFDDVDIMAVSAPVFPIGGGLFFGSGNGFIVEALCNIVPFKGRIAKYVSINASFILDMSIMEGKK